MDTKESLVVVKDLYKTFKLPHEQHSGLKQIIVNVFRSKKGYEVQKVLKGVSFEIKKGEFFGIVGRNGSGKSTLLKLLAGIYAPDKGLVQVNGSLTPFIELGVGFNPELSGRDNVYMNGALLGFDRHQMDEMYDDIVEFAELGRFMDQKLKNYSSGMQVRLAFSIAIRAQSDILLLDEVLAVGDEAFQRKCYDYFEALKRNNKTVIIVTHDMAAVERFCERAILIDKGKIVEEGSAEKIAHAYLDLFNPKKEKEDKPEEEVERQADRWGDGRLKFLKVEMPSVISQDKITIDIDIKCNRPVKNGVTLAYTLKSKDGKSLFGNVIESNKLSQLKAKEKVTYRLSLPLFLSNGDYQVDISLRETNKDEYCDFWSDCCEFTIENSKNEITQLTAA